MQVDHHRHAGQPLGQRGKDEPIRDRVDLDQRVAPAAVGTGKRDRRPHEEFGVLEEVGSDPGPLVALHVQPMHADAVEPALPLGVVPAESEDVHVAAARDDRLGLAPDAWVLLVVGVDDHGHGAPGLHGMLAGRGRVHGVHARPDAAPGATT